MSGITVIKRNFAGQETWRYSGQVLKRTSNAVILEALFNVDDKPFMGNELKRGDRFVELYYSDRWYNIFQIHDRDDDTLKGWYCNICQPAIFESEDQLSFIDLALDLWVSPSGSQTVLDEDEFLILQLDEATKNKALGALDELKTIFKNNREFSITLETI
jgi:protein associated with RNAse G/E